MILVVVHCCCFTSFLICLAQLEKMPERLDLVAVVGGVVGGSFVAVLLLLVILVLAVVLMRTCRSSSKITDDGNSVQGTSLCHVDMIIIPCMCE